MLPNAKTTAFLLVFYCSIAWANGVSSEPPAGAASKNLASLLQKVEAGDPATLIEVGNQHLAGDGVAQDGAEAIRLFKKAVDLGSADGAMHLGRAYFRGRGIQPNQRESIYWFKTETAMREGRPPVPATTEDVTALNSTFPTQIGLQTCKTQVRPTMPDNALKSGKGGNVRAQALIVGGKIRDVSILSGPKLFHDSVIAAMLQYQCDSSKPDVLATQEFAFSISLGNGEPFLYRVELADKWSKVEAPSFNADWIALTAAQKRAVRTRYGNLPASYEPPYPSNGLGALMEDIRVLAEHWIWKGKFDLEVAVDAKGVATGIRVFEAPTQRAKQYAAAVAFNAKYKPGKCDGIPCDMVFPIYFEVVKQSAGSSSDTLEKRASKGQATAQNAMGERYEYGDGVAKDFAAALDWYRKSAAQGFPNGQNNLARMLEAGKSVERNYPEALDWYRLAAEQGYAPSQSNYGYMLAHGRGTDINHAAAVKWFERSAAQGYALGQLNLAEAYMRGHGVKIDMPKAQELYLLAMDNGNTAAHVPIFVFQLLGIGNASELEEAIRRLSANALLGNSSAAALMGVSFARGVGVTQSNAKAFEMYNQSAEKGDAGGQFLLADSYERGLGTPVDMASAFSWYEKAAAQGNVLAMKRLSDMHTEGRGTPTNPEQAKTWDILAKEKKYTIALDDAIQAVLFNRVAERDSKQTLIRYREANPSDAILALERVIGVLQVLPH